MGMRSILCVPANQNSMVEKSAQYQSDQIILDLEDAVVKSEKAAARELLFGLFKNSDITVGFSFLINLSTTMKISSKVILRSS